MGKLIINPGTPQARELELQPGAYSVGRDATNDFSIPDASVSSSHAQLEVIGNSVKVTDLGSTNGTFINRSPVSEAILEPGQLLRLGGVEMVYESDAPGAGAPLGEPLPPIGSAAIVNRPGAVASVAAIPMPPPIAPRLRVASAEVLAVAVATAPEPEQAAPPPDAPGLIELPAGKSICKFHPRNPAQWLCQKCNLPFCSLCVAARQTPEGTGYFCRTCGTQCAPVKVKYTVARDIGPKEYSDLTVLLRSLAFGFGAALLAAIVWGGLAAIMGVVFVMIRPMMCWGTGALCGYAVKIACQDRPGIVFSLIAVGYCLMAVFLGTIAAIICGHFMGGFGLLSIYTMLGLMGGLFTAWRIGGGDF